MLAHTPSGRRDTGPVLDTIIAPEEDGAAATALVSLLADAASEAETVLTLDDDDQPASMPGTGASPADQPAPMAPLLDDATGDQSSS